MSRAGLVTILLVGVDGNAVTCRLRPDTVLYETFSAYVHRAGCAPETTRFYCINEMVGWDSALADHGLSAGVRVNVVAFGWIFSSNDLDYFDQWGVPPLRWRGVFCQIALNAERRRLVDLGYIDNRLRVLHGQRGAFVAQLFGASRGDFNRQERHEEIVITQMAVIGRSGGNVLLDFFRRLDYDQVRLAGRWLNYGLYRMLVLTSSGSLVTGPLSVRQLGGFRIVQQLMGLIGREFRTACKLGHLYHRFCPYHDDLRDFVGLAVRVMRVCHRRVGPVDALTIVRDRVREAGEISGRAFVRVRADPDALGVCPICQDGYELGGYGGFLCGHTMHLHCRLEYEAYERGHAPYRGPRCPLCGTPFEGFRYICM